jgi:ribosomal protein L7/L12
LRARLAGLYPAKGQGRDGDVERLLHQGEKMLAIRLYRELYGADLKTARRRVEELEQKLGAGF